MNAEFHLLRQALAFQIKQKELLIWLATQIVLATYILLLGVSEKSIDNYLGNNLSNLLGADLVIEAEGRLPAKIEQELRAKSNNYSVTQVFHLNVFHGEQRQALSIKNVDTSYPVKGSVTLAKQISGETFESFDSPKSGEIWLGQRALVALKAKVGDTLTILGKPHVISAILIAEPDQLVASESVTPRAVINLPDVDTQYTASLQGVRYLLIQKPGASLDIQPLIKGRQVNVLDVNSGEHPLASVWQRVMKFLGLTGVILFILAAISLDQSSYKIAERQRRFYAICLSLGLPKWRVWFCFAAVSVVYLAFIFGLALTAVTGIESLTMHFLAEFLPGISSSWSIMELSLILGLLSVLYLTNVIPMAFVVSKTSVWDLLSQSIAPVSQTALRWGLIIVALMVIIFFYSDNYRLTGYLLLAITFCVITMLLVCLAIFSGFKLFGHRLTTSLHTAVVIMRQRLMVKTGQICGLGLCLFLLYFTNQLTRDVLNTVERLHVQQDGNLLVTKIPEKDTQDLFDWAQSHNIERQSFRPYVYGKISATNGQAWEDNQFSPSESKQKLESKIRLHWSAKMPENNLLVAGNWENPIPKKNMFPISVVDEVAEDLGLELGDKLTFSINNAPMQFIITSIHAFKPGSSLITFWFTVPLASFDLLIGSENNYRMGSMTLEESHWGLLNDFWQAHPATQMVSLKELLNKLQSYVASLEVVIYGFTIFLTSLCSLVIWSGINVCFDSDKKRNGLMMSFGWSKVYCYRLSFWEWAVTGIVANTGAVFAMWLAGELVYQQIFAASLDFNGFDALILIIQGSIAVVMIGMVLSWRSLQARVLDLLNENTEQSAVPLKFSIHSVRKIASHWRRYLTRLKVVG